MRTRTSANALATLAAALLLAAPVGAYEKTEATIRAYAAGYVAQFTCSATFNGGKTPEQIRAQELTGIYPMVAGIVRDLPPPDIDLEAKRVSVRYDDAMPPRIAAWRPHLGCAQLPVGATIDAARFLPRIDELTVPDAGVDDGGPWRVRAPVNGPSGNPALDAVMAAAIAGDPKYGADAVTSAVLVADPKAILGERYTDGFSPTTSQRTWSVAKSIAATVIGVAVRRGVLDVNAPAPIPEWQRPADPRKAITVQNLLHMASGLDSNLAGNRTDRVYLGGGLVTDTATERSLEAEPGTRWKYANNDCLLAVRALRAVMDDDHAYLRFPFDTLVYAIGMTHTKLETDWDGNFILSSQVWTTSRDLARLGLLYLADGVWNGARILPEGWRDFVSTPAPSQPPPATTTGRRLPRYGAQWWLFKGFPGVPDDAFSAVGNRGQYLVVIPSRDLVIVRRGYDSAGGEGFRIDRFAADVLAAVQDGVSSGQAPGA